MGERVLITGGAGFIGFHLAEALLAQGYQVRVLDNLSAQAHGQLRRRPVFLNPEVELLIGDIRNPQAMSRALADVDTVFHLAASVGVEQSMYALTEYTNTNTLGTATLLEGLLHQPVRRLIVASSMSVYGEGLYLNQDGIIVEGRERPLKQLQRGKWEVRDSQGRAMLPLPTPETKRPSLVSVYATTKFDQERLCLIFGCTYDQPVVVLRLCNCYGPYQSLANPYTGVLAIFTARLLNRRAPLIFEDGLQQRDFVSIHDVTRACLLALQVPAATGQVFNIGSGVNFTLRSLSVQIAQSLGLEFIKPEITGRHRAGDIRHCYADITLAREVLGYEPQVNLAEGLGELADWLEEQVPLDRMDQASAELAARGLTV